MQTLVIVFLAVIAVTALLQAAAAVGAAIAARRLAQRVDELEARFERDLRPALARVARVMDTAADVTDKALAQARRGSTARSPGRRSGSTRPWTGSRAASEERVLGSIEKVEDQVGRRVRTVARPFARAAAIVEGFRRGVIVWRDRRRPPRARRGRAAARRLAELFPIRGPPALLECLPLRGGRPPHSGMSWKVIAIRTRTDGRRV